MPEPFSGGCGQVVFPFDRRAVQSILTRGSFSAAWSEPSVRIMLIPQFTIRRLFWVVTACAVVCMVAVYAARGVAVARSIIAVVGMLVMSFCVFAGLYVWGVLIDRLRPSPSNHAESPFAHHSLPPSYVVPRDE